MYDLVHNSKLARDGAVFGSRADDITTHRYLVVRQNPRKTIKRLIDLAGAFIGIIILSPLMLAIAAVIRLSSRGPVLFKQERVGYLGRRFQMLKFRSMRMATSEKAHQELIEALLRHTVDSAAGGSGRSKLVESYKSQIDGNTTWIGKILRRTSLDELPQLFNVLTGDMSLVGPRPHPVYEVDQYAPWYRARLQVLPGITGLSKVSLRCTPENYDEAMRYDLCYVENWSLWLDLQIMLKTIPLVLRGKGAY